MLGAYLFTLKDNSQLEQVPSGAEVKHWSYHSLFQVVIQSNLDYLKCQGPPDFLRIIGSSNFRNRYFSEMFGSFRSVLIFDCIYDLKMESKVSYPAFENKAKQSEMNLHAFFLFTSRTTT